MKRRALLFIIGGIAISGLAFWGNLTLALSVLTGFVLFLAYLVFVTWAFKSENRLRQALPLIAFSVVLLTLTIIYAIFGYAEGLLGVIIFLGIPGMILLIYIVVKVLLK